MKKQTKKAVPKKAAKPANDKRWNSKTLAALVKENPEGFLNLARAYGVPTVAPSGRKRRTDGLTTEIIAAFKEGGYKGVPREDVEEPAAESDEEESVADVLEKKPAKKDKPGQKSVEAPDTRLVIALAVAALAVTLEREVKRGVNTLFNDAFTRLKKIGGLNDKMLQAALTDEGAMRKAAGFLDHADAEDACTDGILRLVSGEE